MRRLGCWHNQMTQKKSCVERLTHDLLLNMVILGGRTKIFNGSSSIEIDIWVFLVKVLYFDAIVGYLRRLPGCIRETLLFGRITIREQVGSQDCEVPGGARDIKPINKRNQSVPGILYLQSISMRIRNITSCYTYCKVGISSL